MKPNLKIDKMKNAIIFLMFSLLVLVVACGEEEDSVSYNEQKAIDIEKIQNYLLDSNLTAKSTESGLHYIIEVEGTGSYPSVDSIVKIKYTGKFLDGEPFDGGTLERKLNSYILGWQEGIPYFREGSKGMLFIPSSLAYGVYDFYNIPGNSVLVFDIELLDVSN